MSARPSEIRAFLLRYAKKRGIRIQEYISGTGAGEGPVHYFTHLEEPGKDGITAKTATAVSRNGKDDSLIMAFLSLSNSEIDFLD